MAGAIAVVKKVLGFGLVDGDDGVFQLPVGGHCGQPHHAGGGFLGAGDDIGQQVAAFLVQDAHQVGAVVHRYHGRVVEGGVDVAIVGIVVLALDGVGGDAVFLHQGGGGFVLGGQGVAGAQHQVGAAGFEGDGQVGGFGGDVQAGGHADAGQGLLAAEALGNGVDDGHFPAGPADAVHAGRGQGKVFDIAFDILFGQVDLPPVPLTDIPAGAGMPAAVVDSGLRRNDGLFGMTGAPG